MSDLFKNLAMDAWYKVLVYVGGVVLLLALFVPTKGLTNGEVEVLAVGVLLIGLGEWKNHKTAAWFKPPSVYTGGATLMQTIVRRADALGIAVESVGCLILVCGVALTWLRLAG